MEIKLKLVVLEAASEKRGKGKERRGERTPVR